MRFFLFIAGLLLALLALAGTADARMHHPSRGHRIKADAVVDTMATALAAAYSFRKVRSAYAGSAVQLRRVDNSALSSIGFTAGGDFDAAAASTHCTGATCTVATWYDQSGLAKDAVRAAANQPAYVADCGGGKPCARATSSAHLLATSLTYTPVLPVSFSAVANRSAGVGACIWAQQYTANNNLYAFSANVWIVQGGAGGNVAASAADAAWHTGIGVVNGASSVLAIDGVETAGSTTGSTAAGSLVPISGADATTCNVAEVLQWGGYALTAGERTALAENQRNYWAPLPLDTFATPAAAYSMRRLRSAYSGPAVRLRRASDNAEADIGFLAYTGFTGAPIDVAAANAHCTSPCTVVTWYDQSGNARHATMPTAVQQPAYVAACATGTPCMRATAFSALATASLTPAQPLSMSAVAARTAGTGQPLLIAFGANYLFITPTPSLWQTQGTGGSISAAASEGVWHAAEVVVNGASSVLRIDGAETAGTTSVDTTAGALQVLVGAAATTTDFAEAVVWSGYGLTAGERAVLQVNQRSFFGTP